LRIIEIAQLGERDPNRLRDDALLYLTRTNLKSTGINETAAAGARARHLQHFPCLPVFNSSARHLAKIKSRAGAHAASRPLRDVCSLGKAKKYKRGQPKTLVDINSRIIMSNG
jgi:hypothetical protein